MRFLQSSSIFPAPHLLLLTTLLSTVAGVRAESDSDALPSWQGTAREEIISFVESTLIEDSADFVPIPERIAVFDNDGSLWSEQPIYFQLYFVMDRIKELAATDHPEWETQQPFAAALSGDPKQVLAQGRRGLATINFAANIGMSNEEYSAIVRDWIQTARHPETKLLFTDMVFQPMLELLDYLRNNDYKTFIVSGGSDVFMRSWTERIYGIPPEQVIGSSPKLAYREESGTIQRLNEPGILVNKENKS